MCGRACEHLDARVAELDLLSVQNPYRGSWALETGLPYRVHGLDHTGGEFDGEAYSRIRYFHQAPVIDDEGFIIAESGVLYLAEKAGMLIPSERCSALRQRVPGSIRNIVFWKSTLSATRSSA